VSAFDCFGGRQFVGRSFPARGPQWRHARSHAPHRPAWASLFSLKSRI